MMESGASLELVALSRRINNILAIFDSEHLEYIHFTVDEEEQEKVVARLLAAAKIIETLAPLIDTVEELLNLDIPVDVFNERWDIYMDVVDETSSEPDDPDAIGTEVMGLLKNINGESNGNSESN